MSIGLRGWITAALTIGALASVGSAQEPAPEAGDTGTTHTGTLFVRGDDGVSRPALALATDVEIVVSGLVARTRVRQEFHNQSDEWLEGTYVFPLPEMSAVDRMVLQIGERRIEGRIEEREQAKRTYQRARAEGRAASLLEQERPNLFTTSVANIGPGETVDIVIEYQQTVRYEARGFSLRFPMTLTARYIPGGEEPVEETFAPVAGTGWGNGTPAVPDAARITPPMLHPDSGIVNPLLLRVVLDAGFPIERIESPTHPIEVAPLGDDLNEVWIERGAADRDFVLEWAPPAGEEPRTAIFSEEFEGAHYALLMVLPPSQPADGHRLPREAVYVIDTSGSMAGTSIVQARAALHLALDHLSPDDTFNVIAFDSTHRTLFSTSQPATRSHLERAHAFVRGLEASGGTEMVPALRRALLDPIGDTARVRQVVFITDGSIGNEEAIFAALDADRGRSRLFMVGIGSAPNAYLLNRAAERGRGTATSINSLGDVQQRMERLFRKLESPVLRDIEVLWNDEVEMWPERVPDLYAGEPIVLAARLDRFVGDVRVRARRGDRQLDISLPLTPGAEERGIHQLWARRKIAHWMGRRASGESPGTIREEVLDVALEHQIVSRFTSLVAVDTTPARSREAALRRTNVPNHGPAGFAPGGVPGVLPQGATPAPLLTGLGALLGGLGLVLRRGVRR